AALVVIANLSALAAAALVHRLAWDETGDADLARRAAWLMALLPPSFVLVMAYSEGLFLLLSTAMMLALRRRRFGLAAGLGFLTGLTRPTGLLMVVPAAVEAATGARTAGRSGLVTRAAAVLAPAAGCAAYLLWVGHVFGDRLLPVRIQQQPTFRGATRDP